VAGAVSSAYGKRRGCSKGEVMETATEMWTRGGQKKIIIATFKNLLKCLSRLKKTQSELLLQKRIVGEDMNLSQECAMWVVILLLLKLKETFLMTMKGKQTAW